MKQLARRGAEEPPRFENDSFPLSAAAIGTEILSGGFSGWKRRRDAEARCLAPDLRVNTLVQWLQDKTKAAKVVLLFGAAVTRHQGLRQSTDKRPHWSPSHSQEKCQFFCPLPPGLMPPSGSVLLLAADQ